MIILFEEKSSTTKKNKKQSFGSKLLKGAIAASLLGGSLYGANKYLQNNPEALDKVKNFVPLTKIINIIPSNEPNESNDTPSIFTVNDIRRGTGTTLGQYGHDAAVGITGGGLGMLTAKALNNKISMPNIIKTTAAKVRDSSLSKNDAHIKNIARMLSRSKIRTGGPVGKILGSIAGYNIADKLADEFYDRKDAGATVGAYLDHTTPKVSDNRPADLSSGINRALIMKGLESRGIIDNDMKAKLGAPLAQKLDLIGKDADDNLKYLRSYYAKAMGYDAPDQLFAANSPTLTALTFTPYINKQ